LQDRVIVGDFNGFSNVEFESGVQCSQGGYSTHWENIYFYTYWIDKNIYIVYETELTTWWNLCFEMIWLVSIMFKLYQWCLRIDAWVKGVNGFKVFEYILRLGFKLCKLFENMSCWNCLCFIKKLSFEWF
jgi:hypothetical protein